MEKNKTRIYIDGANLHQGMKSKDSSLDYEKFYKYLANKYHPEVIYIFIGKMEKHKFLYNFLKECGYKIIFKETYQNQAGEIKGNVDAEIVLTTVQEFYEKNYNCGVLVSGDGDFSCLIDFWKNKKITPKILAPKKKNCSYFLKNKNVSLTFLDDKRLNPKIIKPKSEKAPDND